MEGEWDWDLQAVVRGCSGGGANTRKDPPFFLPPPLQLSDKVEEQQAEKDEKSGGGGELELLYKPFFPKSSPEMIHLLHHHQQQQQSTSSSAAVSLLLTGAPAKKQNQRHQQRQRQVSTTRSKRRKNQQKKVVCQVPEDGLSSDMWAWRKYGQKPIKGSPYPRGYYRCSTSKGCLAKKQVERNKTDPNIFIVTYTADHNHAMPTHRNSLAGSTRHKFLTSNTTITTTTTTTAQIESTGTRTGTGEENRASLAYPTSYMSPNTPLTSTSMEEDVAVVAPAVRKKEADEVGEEETLLVSDMEVLGVDDIFFLGLEDLHQPNSLTNNFPSMEFSSSPWHTAAAPAGVDFFF